MNAASAWQSSHSGQTYTLVFDEALWMGETMDHTLINPNQLRHFGALVQDDPAFPNPLSIITEDREFCMELSMEGTIVYVDTHTPTDAELDACPKVELSSPYPWNPHQVKFPSSKLTLEEEVGGMQYLSGISTLRQHDLFYDLETICFKHINRSIASVSKVIPEETSADTTETQLIQDESLLRLN